MLKLYKYMRPFSKAILGVFLFVFFQTVCDLYLPTLSADIIDKGVMQGDTNKIFQIGGIMLLVTAFGVISSVIASYLSAKSAVGLGTIIRSKVFNQVESFSLNEFDKIGTSTLITRTTNDINQIQMVTVMILRMMISAPLMALGGLILAFRRDRALTLVLAVAIPVLGLVVAVLASKMMPLFRLVQKKIDRINLVLREKLTGVRIIRAFNTEPLEEKRFEDANLDLTNNFIKVNRIMAFMMPSIMLVMNLTALSILWFGGLRISTGAMELGALSAFTQYAMHIMFSMLMLSMMFIMVPRAQAAAVRINEILDTEADIKNPGFIKNVYDETSAVEFSNVTFSYNDAEEPALSNISFTAKPGEVTAIIGSTGSGKSTLVNLIPRFYDIQRGRISINGVDVREMSQEKLRSKIGYVPQKAVIFNDTIAQNIRLGNEKATDEEIRRAAEVAQAAEFINDLEDGFEHEIAQGGTNISGGQKQRLSIARALARKAEIYIFDDTFSALDFKTDAKLRAELRKEVQDATVIIVAQRVGTVMDAEQIIVLDKGSIVGKGTHKELLNTCRVYQEIVSSQFSGKEMTI